MKTVRRNTYNQFHRPPTPLFKTSLDNIAIVPASLLPFIHTWQEMANKLPQGSVLICHSSTNVTQKRVLDSVRDHLKAKGHAVTSIPIEQVT